MEKLSGQNKELSLYRCHVSGPQMGDLVWLGSIQNGPHGAVQDAKVFCTPHCKDSWTWSRRHDWRSPSSEEEAEDQQRAVLVGKIGHASYRLKGV